MAETFAELNVPDALAAAAKALGFSKPTALQQRLLPVLQSGTDVLLRTHSGSGRTLAYLLALMQRLLEGEPLEGRGPRSLILLPSRDKAMRLGRTIKELGRETPLRFGTLVGGRPYPMQHQMLRRPLDILVATPGRLMDHIRRGRVPFERLEVLVIDRLDQMFEMDLEADLEFIAGAAPGQRQRVLLTEQLSEAAEALAERLLNDPRRIEHEAPEERAPEQAKSSKPREARRPPRQGHGGQARKPRGQKNGTAPREVNGNVAPQGLKPQNKPKISQKKAARPGIGNKADRRAPARRGGGQGGRRQPGVRFPSDYANGPHTSQSPADAAEQHRAVKRHEPQQYLADYGFSSGPRNRKPVTVVYRGKSRKPPPHDDSEGDS